MRAVNTRLLIMLVTGRHAKHMQNYLNWAQIMHEFCKRSRVGKCDEVIKYSAQMLSSFRNVLLNVCNNSDQT